MPQRRTARPRNTKSAPKKTRSRAPPRRTRRPAVKDTTQSHKPIPERVPRKVTEDGTSSLAITTNGKTAKMNFLSDTSAAKDFGELDRRCRVQYNNDSRFRASNGKYVCQSEAREDERKEILFGLDKMLNAYKAVHSDIGKVQKLYQTVMSTMDTQIKNGYKVRVLTEKKSHFDDYTKLHLNVVNSLVTRLNSCSKRDKPLYCFDLTHHKELEDIQTQLSDLTSKYEQVIQAFKKAIQISLGRKVLWKLKGYAGKLMPLFKWSLQFVMSNLMSIVTVYVIVQFVPAFVAGYLNEDGFIGTSVVHICKILGIFINLFRTPAFVGFVGVILTDIIKSYGRNAYTPILNVLSSMSRMFKREKVGSEPRIVHEKQASSESRAIVLVENRKDNTVWRYECVSPYDMDTAGKTERVKSCKRTRDGTYKSLQQCVHKCGMTDEEKCDKIVGGRAREHKKTMDVSRNTLFLFYSAISYMVGNFDAMLSLSDAIVKRICYVAESAASFTDRAATFVTGSVRSITGWIPGLSSWEWFKHAESLEKIAGPSLFSGILAYFSDPEVEQEFISGIADAIGKTIANGKPGTEHSFAWVNCFFEGELFDFMDATASMPGSLRGAAYHDFVRKDIIEEGLRKGFHKDVQSLLKYIGLVVVLFLIVIMAVVYIFADQPEVLETLQYTFDDTFTPEITKDIKDLRQRMQRLEKCLLEHEC